MSSPQTPWAAFGAWLEAAPLRRTTLVCVLATLAVYAGMPAEEFTFDNAFIIGDDTRLRVFTAESLSAIFRFDYWWPSMASNLFRPLTTLSFWLEYTFLGYGRTPLGYQLGNAALHCLNAVLLFRLGTRLRLSAIHAFLAALVFCVHPVATEAVANIVGRSDLFATAATLGGLCFYFDALAKPVGRSRTRSLLYMGLCGFAGVMAKESAIVLPAIVAVHGLLRSGELRGEPSARLLWVRDAWISAAALAPCAIFFLVTRWIFSSAPGVSDSPFIDNPLVMESFLGARFSALGVWGMQIATLFLPLKLSNDYSFNAIPAADLPFGNETAWWSWGTLLVFLTAAVLAWRAYRGRPALLFLFAAYFLAMLPTSNLLVLIGSIRAERFHYTPSAFFWLALAVALPLAARCLQKKDRASLQRLGSKVASVGLAAWCSCIALLAHVRCYDWRSNYSLWMSAKVVQPNSLKVMSGAGNAPIFVAPTEENEKAAVQAQLNAIEVYKEKNIPRYNWSLQFYSDLLASCINLHDQAVARKAPKEESDAWLERGLALIEESDSVDKAIRARWAELYGDKLTETAPLMDVLQQNRALIFARKGRYEEAIQSLDEVLRLLPLKASNYSILADIHDAAGRTREALDLYLLTRVMEPSRAGDLQRISSLAKRVDDKSVPLLPDQTGELKLNLNDKLIGESTRHALVRYRGILLKCGMTQDAARIMRMARYEYGFRDFGEPRS